jgi:hypothetical protein
MFTAGAECQPSTRFTKLSCERRTDAAAGTDDPDPFPMPVGNFWIQAFHDRFWKNRVSLSDIFHLQTHAGQCQAQAKLVAIELGETGRAAIAKGAPSSP